jgi:hypothetical protein
MNGQAQVSAPRRNSGLIVIGMTTTVIMSGLATMLVAPILVGDLRGPMRDRIGRALDGTEPGLRIHEQWRAVDVRERGRI